MILVRLVLVMILFSSFNRSEELTFSYIDTYQELAVIEMHRTGVPASITLAQAILESQSGTSSLAVNSNNHFGIKCKSYWNGNSYYHKDDDRDPTGKLIPSCFRAYNEVMDSYIDHSNFLKYSAHYGKLFTIDMKDYEGWARGLKECGYATDKSYAEKLIKTIKKYQLFVYDDYEDPRTWINKKS